MSDLNVAKTFTDTLAAVLGLLGDGFRENRLQTLVALVALYLSRRVWLARDKRTRVLPPANERVLILGASSGIGRSLAHEYASRGARVCVVGRREVELERVVQECLARYSAGTEDKGAFYLVADFSNVSEMVKVREAIHQKWGGFDTLIVCAGVSALRPVLEIAGIEGKAENPSCQPSVEGIQRTVNVAHAALQGNYIGPLVSAVTLIPLLSASVAPSMVLISSLAALIPAPTRAIYGSTKASSLLLYQTLAIEHPAIKFTHIIPGTVAGNFRASAVDSGVVREADPDKHGLQPTAVAKRTLRAVDAGEKAVFMPATTYSWPFIYWTFPAIMEWGASKKYNFTPTS